MFRSSNPALADGDTFQQYYGEMAGARPDVATLNGVINKTAILVLLTAIAGAGGYRLVSVMPSITWISAIAAFVVVLGLGFVMRGNPKASVFVAPVYAVIEGIFLGSLTGALDSVLRGIPAVAEATQAGGAGAATGGAVSIALPAFLITISIMMAMLGLYYARILRPTRRFQAIVSTAVVGIMITYGLMFVLSFFGVSMPFLSLSSAFQGGWAGLIGIGLNLLILGVAAMVLIMDFGRVEEIVNSGAPRYMEWYAGFALLVTLAWIYFEAVRLVFRLYVMFGNRD